MVGVGVTAADRGFASGAGSGSGSNWVVGWSLLVDSISGSGSGWVMTGSGITC